MNASPPSSTQIRHPRSKCGRFKVLSRLFFVLPVLLGFTLSSCASRTTAPHLPTVARVDLPRYMGKWHEIARLDMFFQRGCVDSTAEYSLQPGGTVSVVNRCLKDGKPKSVRGTASVVDPKTNAVLEVRFNEWFSAFIPRAREGNYFIVWLAPDYSAAAVGTPSRKYLWLLSRTPTLSPDKFKVITEHCRTLGFPVDKLVVEEGAVAARR
jgi:apolipoprotein D and lipocalin family protein